MAPQYTAQHGVRHGARRTTQSTQHTARGTRIHAHAYMHTYTWLRSENQLNLPWPGAAPGRRRHARTANETSLRARHSDRLCGSGCLKLFQDQCDRTLELVHVLRLQAAYRTRAACRKRDVSSASTRARACDATHPCKSLRASVRRIVPVADQPFSSFVLPVFLWLSFLPVADQPILKL